jgi:glutathione S-transferase
MPGPSPESRATLKIRRSEAKPVYTLAERALKPRPDHERKHDVSTPTTAMKIHNFPRGARGQRVMWLCEEMGLGYTVENHAFPVAPTYRALNPLGTVPFLQDADGVAINESVAMMLYIVERYGPTPLLPTGNAALMARCLQLTLFGETEIGMNLNPLIAARFMAGAADKRNWSVLGLEQRVGRAIQHAATLVGPDRYLVGDDLTIADISVSCGLDIWQGALGGELPAELAAYQERLHARPAFQRAKARCAAAASA